LPKLAKEKDLGSMIVSLRRIKELVVSKNFLRKTSGMLNKIKRRIENYL
tara:strand:- start:498 stop:644 length:147 start_codon:yes stop_codon:yes gene_type:complete